jgi:hypothetical protein
MCIIASIPVGKQISKSTLQRCWNNNQHGGGFMFTDGEKIITFKELTSFKRYWKAFAEARTTHPDSCFVAHFRISTHGKIDETNCHPFLVDDKIGFVHNGIIRNAPVSKDYSDTFMFNATILQNLPKGFLENHATMSLIQEYIGSGSKLCFLTHENKMVFVNEKAGEWDENGVWFSNGGYKEWGYYDRGGVRTGAYGTTWGSLPPVKDAKRDTHKASYRQSNMGFASAVYREEKPKINNINWEEKLKVKNIDANVVGYAKSDCCDAFDVSKAYDKNCGFCDTLLKGNYEQNSGYCMRCEEKYASDWAI